MEEGGKRVGGFNPFRLYSQWKLRPKLIGIISTILVLALGSMIFLATYFFRKESDGNVRENNIQFANLLAENVQGELVKMIEKLDLISEVLIDDFKSVQQRSKFTDLFARNDKNFLFAAVTENDGGALLRVRRQLVNEAALAQAKIALSQIESATLSRTEEILRARSGETVILNVSDLIGSPVFVLAVPFQRDEGGRALSLAFGYYRLDPFLKFFKKSGIRETFLVHSSGEVIAHSDPKVVLARGNLLSLPIVEYMLRSPIDNKQMRYASAGQYYLGSFKKIAVAGLGVVVTAPENKAFEVVFNIQRRNIYFTLFVLILATVVVYFFAKSLSVPLVHLVDATAEVEKGRFDVEVKNDSGDEIGILTRSFNAMTTGLKERERLKSTLGRFVNKEIAEMAAKGELRLGGERREAAVFFSDIRSFTAISEKLQPEEVVEFLNQYFTRMVRLVDTHKGSVDKFIGDAIMALWGVPISHGNDCENAILCSLAMRKNLLEFNEERAKEGKFPLKIGMGINYGPLLSGQIGSEDHISYTVIGDTVNLASRIEALNKPFGTDLLITQDAYEKTKGLFDVSPMQKIKVKGKEDVQQVYAVLRAVNDESGPKTIEALREMLGTEAPAPPAHAKRRSSDQGEEDDDHEVKYEIVE